MNEFNPDTDYATSLIFDTNISQSEKAINPSIRDFAADDTPLFLHSVGRWVEGGTSAALRISVQAEAEVFSAK